MEKSDRVEKIMEEFLRRTCLSGEECTPRRYLWTDAFAVCNLVNLYRKTDDPLYKEEALKLVNQVHHVLGKHRSDDSRNGWISGLSEEEGEAHPTIGGLRIGKKHNERRRDEPHNEQAEWEQDGQYYHYLTKWMHVLDLVAEMTYDIKYREWALELADVAYRKFTYETPAHNKRMYWKMSIDLSYPLVPSMGQHDALDGFITYSEINGSASKEKGLPVELLLDASIAELKQMAQSINWESDDPLGIGGLLSDASLLAQLIVTHSRMDLSDMLYRSLGHSLKGLEAFMRTDTLKYQAQYRLPFREFGLSIGLHGLEKIKSLLMEHTGSFTKPDELLESINSLEPYVPLADYIEKFWLESANQQSKSWTEHLDINEVMLATSLEPEGFLRLPVFE